MVVAVGEFWDHRLRHHFKSRFDVRKNLIDWDYQTNIRPTSGMLHSVLYRDWRMKGLAFEFGDETYTHPNKTLGSYIEVSERHTRLNHRLKNDGAGTSARGP